MANNYLEFSAMLFLDNQEELDWLKGQLEEVPYKIIGKEPGKPVTKLERVVVVDWDKTPEYDEEVSPILAEAVGGDGEYDDWADWENGLDFMWEVEDAAEGQIGIWIYSGESGNPDHVAFVVHKYLRHFNKPGVFTMSWAAYCSKPRVDEQGGGAVVVTKDLIDVMNVQVWASKRVTELEEERDVKN